MSKSFEDWKEARTCAIDARKHMYDAMDVLDNFPFMDVGEESQRIAGERLEGVIRVLNRLIGECTTDFHNRSEKDDNGEYDDVRTIKCLHCLQKNFMADRYCSNCGSPVHETTSVVYGDSNSVRETNIEKCGNDTEGSPEKCKGCGSSGKLEDWYCDKCWINIGQSEGTDTVHDLHEWQGGRCKSTCKACAAGFPKQDRVDLVRSIVEKRESAYRDLDGIKPEIHTGCTCPMCSKLRDAIDES